MPILKLWLACWLCISGGSCLSRLLQSYNCPWPPPSCLSPQLWLTVPLSPCGRLSEYPSVPTTISGTAAKHLRASEQKAANERWRACSWFWQPWAVDFYNATSDTAFLSMCYCVFFFTEQKELTNYAEKTTYQLPITNDHWLYLVSWIKATKGKIVWAMP